MVVQFVRLAGKLTGSKALLLPVVGLAVVTFGSLSITYRTTRDGTASLIGCKQSYTNTSVACQTVANSISAIPTLGYVYYRLINFRQPTLDDIAAQLDKDNILTDKRITDPNNRMHTTLTKLQQQRRVLYAQLRAPMLWYGVTAVVSAVIVGVSTSVVQRVVCDQGSKPVVVDKLAVAALEKKK